MDDRLVGTHPRDELLVLRQGNLKGQIISTAYSKYNSLLDQFAKKFMADENISLAPAPKKELAKIYASYCKKWIGLVASFWLSVLTGIGLAATYQIEFLSHYFFDR